MTGDKALNANAIGTNKAATKATGRVLPHDSLSISGHNALHQYRPGRWHLCDRRYVNGKQRHLVVESYKSKPELTHPRILSGVAEERLAELPDHCADLIYLDPPFGLTAGEWDVAPDWSWLGSECCRLLKKSGQIVLHGQGIMMARASTAFEASGLQFRYELTWIKASDNGFRPGTWISDKLPLRAHELMHVFQVKGTPASALTFNSMAMQSLADKPYHYKRLQRNISPLQHRDGWQEIFYGGAGRRRSPVDVILSYPFYNGQLYASKPEHLVRVLIALLTNPGDFVVDPYAGLGTTLKIAYLTGRKSLGIEASPERFNLLRETFEPELKREAEKRKGGKPSKTSGKLPEVSEPQVRDQIASYIGISGSPGKTR